MKLYGGPMDGIDVPEGIEEIIFCYKAMTYDTGPSYDVWDDDEKSIVTRAPITKFHFGKKRKYRYVHGEVELEDENYFGSEDCLVYDGEIHGET